MGGKELLVGKRHSGEHERPAVRAEPAEASRRAATRNLKELTINLLQVQAAPAVDEHLVISRFWLVSSSFVAFIPYA